MPVIRPLLERSSLAVLLVLLTTCWLRADEQQAADLLPDTVVLYAEVPRPKELISAVLDHPAYTRFQQSQAYQGALQQPQVVQLRAAVALIELQIGRTWRNAFENILGNEVAIAVDGKTQGVALLVHSAEPVLLDKTRDVILNLTRDEATKKGDPDPFRSEEHQGITVYQRADGTFATLGEWLLVSNNAELMQAMLERHRNPEQPSLRERPQFQQAHQQRQSDEAMWAFADLEALRQANASPELLGGKAKDPGGELILGGLLSNLSQAPYATAELTINEQQISLAFATPHDPAWSDDSREYFFGPEGQGHAPPLINLPESLLSISAYRNISGMWLRAGDLFNKEVNDQLATADSTLTTLFSGRDFGEDILGAIHPEVQFVIVRQTFAEGSPVPAIKLPAFAFVAQLREPERMRIELRRTFQSLVGFLNIVGAMNGQPQLDLHDEQSDKHLLVTATYAPEVDRPAETEAKINYNFSPCLAFVGGQVVLSSTVPLARQLADLATTGSESEAGTNTLATSNLAAIRQILEDNRGHLISQNMLEKGHTREEAENEIATVFAILEHLNAIDMQLTATDRLQLRFTVTLNSNP